MILRQFTNKCIKLKDHNSPFYDNNCLNVCKLQKYLYKNYLIPSYKQCFNTLILHLKKSNLLPALCFCFSRKLVETYASSITLSLHDDNGVIASTVENEREKSYNLNYLTIKNIYIYPNILI